jgi:UDP-N-acetylglucosamine acyltransferase
MSTSEVFVHPTSTVHPKAQLGPGVWIGPQCVIGERVAIREKTRLEASVFIDGNTEIGEECRFSAFSVIGTAPQDVGYKEEETQTIIGSRNIFREFFTVNRGTIKGGGKTVIGSDNYFMAHSHVGHDCLVGSSTVFTHAGTLGGHVCVEDFATIGAFSAVHQFCRVGRHAFIGGFTVVTQDVLPFSRVAGMRPVLFYGLNAIGLRRHGFSRERINDLKNIFKVIFYSNLNTTQAIEKIKILFPPHEDREEIIRFIQSSARGIIKKSQPESWDGESEL